MLQMYILCGKIILVIAIAAFIPVAIKYFSLRIGYKDSIYYKSTKHRFHKVVFDKGAYGEYLTSRELKNLNPPGLFLFNLYLPKNKSETTELDVVLIHQSGIYVFESKNYSGWIFGAESQRQWTQTLKSDSRTIKNHFFNPIMQNELHIKWLKNILEDYPDTIYHSFILFSDRCTLKKIELTTNKALVMNRHQVLPFVKHCADKTGVVLRPEAMQSIYNRLYPYAQVSDDVKQKHIDDIIVNHSVNHISSAQKKYEQKTPQTETAESEKPEIAPKQQAVAEAAPQAIEQTNKENTNVESVKLCPKCGKPMVMRTARRGANAGNQFLGCSGFPHCRYIEKITSGEKKEDLDDEKTSKL